MKIDSYIAATGVRSNAIRVPVKSTAGAGSGTSTDAATAAVSPIDTVKLTGNAVQLQRSEQVLPSSTINSQRVTQLKQAIADGSYQVDAAAVADKLQRMDWQLGAG